MARTKVTYESKIKKAIQKIEEKPRDALKEIGKFLAKEVRDKAPKSLETRTIKINGRQVTLKPGRLKRSIGYWYRKRDKDLQVGSKAFYAKWLEFGSTNNRKQPFLINTVEQNVPTIQRMIERALRGLNKEL